MKLVNYAVKLKIERNYDFVMVRAAPHKKEQERKRGGKAPLEPENHLALSGKISMKSAIEARPVIIVHFL